MAKEPQIIVPEERTPSYFNRHLITGAKLGLISTLGAVVAMAVTGGAAAFSAPWALPILAASGGLLVGASSGAGCIRGREAIARNHAEGRTVNPPSLLNEGLAQGTMTGAIIGLGLVAMTALTAGAGTIAFTLASLAAVATTGLMGYYQGRSHEEWMAKEYETAKSKGRSKERGLLGKTVEAAKSTGKAVGKATETALGAAQITADESTELLSKLKDGLENKADWRETVSKPATKETELQA